MSETLKTLWSISARRHKNLVTALALSFVQSTIGITQLLAVIVTVQVLLGSLPVRSGLVRVVVLTLLCVVGSFVVSYVQQINSLKAGMYTVADQRTQVAARLRRMPLGFFRLTAVETIIATLTTTLQGVEMAASMTMVGIVSGLCNAAAMSLFMLWYDWPIALLMMAGIAVYLLVVRLQMQASRRDAPARQQAQTNLSGAALTFLQGIRVTKSCCTGGDETFQRAIDRSADANIELTDRSMPSQFAAHLSIAAFESLLLLATLYFTFVSKTFSPEKAIVLLIFSFFAYASLNQAGSILSMIGMIESGLEEVQRLKRAPVLPEQEGAAPESDGVRLEDVSFSYGTRRVLEHVSAEFAPHTLTAIIGPSGSGKTTLCRLIARFQDVEAGRVTVGGVDVREIPYDELMKKISIVFQNVYLFEDTILNNIRFGCPEATLDEVRAAARAARCDEFIMALPEGYQTVISEGGGSLSGGERQRISIARAMLKNAPIVLLDEATSALDVENEQAFFRAVDELTRDKTVIMIAHRLATLQHADRIIAIRDGAVVQSGTPEELAQKPGLYREFLDARQSAAGWQL